MTKREQILWDWLRIIGREVNLGANVNILVDGEYIEAIEYANMADVPDIDDLIILKQQTPSPIVVQIIDIKPESFGVTHITLNLICRKLHELRTS